MSVTSNRTVTIQFSGDVEYAQEFESSPNASGSGQNQLTDLSSGNNSITIPTSAVAVTIIPPADNAVVLKIKGVNGDTGVIIHLTDPTSIGLGSGATLVIDAASSVTGLRLIWS